MAKERPILFSVPMVQSILNDRKQKTRRLFVPTEDELSMLESPIELSISNYPYGNIGDVLWVREEHYRFGNWVRNGVTPLGNEKYIFKATTDEVRYSENPPPHFYISRTKYSGWYKRLARFMPRKYCRLYLKITSNHIERLIDISDEDVLQEGISSISKDGGRTYKYGIPDMDGLPGGCDIGWAWHDWQINPQEAFKKLWQDINGPESWSPNSYVYVIEFEKQN